MFQRGSARARGLSTGCPLYPQPYPHASNVVRITRRMRCHEELQDVRHRGIVLPRSRYKLVRNVAERPPKFQKLLTAHGAGTIFGFEGTRGLFSTDTRLAGTRCRNPRRGEALFGELPAFLDRDSEGQGPPAVRRRHRVQAHGRRFRDERRRRGGSYNPWRGKNSREDRAPHAACRQWSNGLPRRRKPGR